MLVGFSVSNFRSFKETQSFSFVASKITRHSEHVMKNGDKRYLRGGVVFGANASGKSNLIRAVSFSREIILNGLDKVSLTKNHFRIENAMYTTPGVFEYRIITGGKEYSYGIAISYADREIIGEWLVELLAGGSKENVIFNREVDERHVSHTKSEYNYRNPRDKEKMEFCLEAFGENITDAYKMRTILSDIAPRFNSDEGIFSEIKKIYEWFRHVIILYPHTRYNKLNEVASDEQTRTFFTNKIRFFDTGIEAISNQNKAMDFEKILDGIPPEDAEKIKVDISNGANRHPVMLKINDQVFILHKDENGNLVYNKLLLDHGNTDDFFEYADESDGTKRLFDLIPILYEKRENALVLIDEIDRSLHTILTKKFIELFYSCLQQTECQLVATTHDSNLLDLDLLRQDEIWFVERQKDHSSRVYSLNAFKARFDKRVDKEYLLGRYGAIPVFQMDVEPEECYGE